MNTEANAMEHLTPTERVNEPAHLKAEILAKLAYVVGKDPIGRARSCGGSLDGDHARELSH